MDNERRHQLQQNELADQLDKAKAWIEPYVVPILIGVIAVTLIGIVVNFIQTQQSSTRSQATFDLLLSAASGLSGEEDPEVYDGIAREYAGTTPGNMALISKADVLLSDGIEALYRDREEAKTLLDDAVEAYEKVRESTEISLLKSRASFGLAQAYESQGNLEAAIKAYEDVVLLNESKQMADVAESRMAMLKSTEMKDFANWFSQQEPNAFDPATPPGLPDASQLPEFPNITLPGTENSQGLLNPGTEGSSPLSNLLNGPLSSGNLPLVENPDIIDPSETPSTSDSSTDSPAGDQPTAESEQTTGESKQTTGEGADVVVETAEEGAGDGNGDVSQGEGSTSQEGESPRL